MKQTLHFPLAQTHHEWIVNLLYECIVNFRYVSVGWRILSCTGVDSNKRTNGTSVCKHGRLGFAVLCLAGLLTSKKDCCLDDFYLRTSKLSSFESYSRGNSIAVEARSLLIGRAG